MTHPTLAPVAVAPWRPQHVNPHMASDDYEAEDERLIATLSPRRYLVGNTPRLFYGVGDVGVVLGRSPITVRKWIRTGLMPETPFKYTTPDIRGSRRLFTEGMVVGVRRIAREEGVLVMYVVTIKRTAFRERVAELYERELQIMQAA